MRKASSTFNVLVDREILVPAVRAVFDTSIAAPEATLALTTALAANSSAPTASSANIAFSTA